MASTTMFSIERDTCTITIGGKKMTMAEYKKQLKEKKDAEKKTTKRRKKTEKKEISIVAEKVEGLIKPITTLKSLACYYDHAYRMWGTIANEILQNRKIRPHFVYFRVNVSELEKLITDVKEFAKRNEKAAYQYVEKITWKLEDIKENISNIMKGATESGYLEAYKDKECINGKGRRLGLQTLVYRSFKAISQLEDSIKELQKIADNGTDPFSYGDHMSVKARARCWA